MVRYRPAFGRTFNGSLPHLLDRTNRTIRGTGSVPFIDQLLLILIFLPPLPDVVFVRFQAFQHCAECEHFLVQMSPWKSELLSFYTSAKSRYVRPDIDSPFR